MRYQNNPPDAASLMMSARSFGNYDLPSALADLIDNSITAQAKKIQLFCFYNLGKPEVRIIDDGVGMTETRLHEAMRPASTNPTKERSPDDLGRFGWGMKSASFSQCRKLTVVTKRSGAVSGAQWDLDDIDQWKMGILSQKNIDEMLSLAPFGKSGTAVFWDNCDRLSEEGKLKEAEFNDLIVHARQRLALIFHRFISGDVKGKKLKIELNGQPIKSFDPFHRENPATQDGEIETISIQDQGKVKKVKIVPYILPHYSKLAQADYDRLGGEEGFIRNQGFYIYRNNRLIMNGTWFRLVRHGELSQLVRISLDIPNTLDDMWKITVDKGDAQLPTALRTRLKDIIEGFKKKSSRVFRSRGGKIGRPGTISVWQKYAKNGEIKYAVNKEHPVIDALLGAGNENDRAIARAAIGLIEQSLPVIAFGEDAAKNPDAVHQTETNPRKFMASLDASLPLLLAQEDGNMKALLQRLKITEPYNNNWPAVEEHLAAKGWLK